MDTPAFERLVVVLTVVVVPAIVAILAIVLDRKGPARVTWSGYIVGALLVGFLVFLSPTGWIALLPDEERDSTVMLANGNLIFGPWLGAFVTTFVGLVGGGIGYSRHQDRLRDIETAANRARWLAGGPNT
ncbi:MAG: hypothetical protein JWQ43_4028 [Glaciihabitans sp.]|nr:hypothetical protein [Glaciihabitans sp.]